MDSKPVPTYTRAKLHAMHQESVIKAEKKRQEYVCRMVDQFTREIILTNEKGATTYSKILYNESEKDMSDILQYMKQIFTDSVIELHEEHKSTSKLLVTWTM